jgi:hypothetical protein
VSLSDPWTGLCRFFRRGKLDANLINKANGIEEDEEDTKLLVFFT